LRPGCWSNILVNFESASLGLNGQFSVGVNRGDARRRPECLYVPEPFRAECKGEIGERVERSYGVILQARDADVARKPRVMMAALIYAKREHVYQVDTLSMMLTTDQWIPLEALHELPLIEALQREQRAFMKPLKCDAGTATADPVRV
jgi:Protein of unknown function (DUF1173)